MIRAATLLTLSLSGPAMADTGQNALDWLHKGIGFETTVMTPGKWRAKGAKLFTTDPLTLLGTNTAPLKVPAPPADVIGLLEPEQGRTAAMMLMWSDAPVVCGNDLTTIGVDTGLAGFLSPHDLMALQDYGEKHGDLYQGTYAEQLDAAVPTVPFIVELPGARFVAAGSGWGDGGYPVANLIDAQGQIVALYAQFITAGSDWLLPPPCTGQSS